MGRFTVKILVAETNRAVVAVVAADDAIDPAVSVKAAPPKTSAIVDAVGFEMGAGKGGGANSLIVVV